MKYQTKLSILFTGFLFSLLIISCKKSHPAATDPKTILEGKNWKRTAITSNPAYNGVTDIYNTIVEDCVKDDLFKFNAGNILVYDNAQVSCDPSDPQTYSGTWNYDASTKVLFAHLTGGGFTFDENYLILEINETSFKATTDLTENGIVYTFTYSFQKQ